MKLWAAYLKPVTPRRPFTGAWIETAPKASKLYPSGVAPSRGRGLKRTQVVGINWGRESPLHGGVD